MRFKTITSEPILKSEIEREALHKAHSLAHKGKLKKTRLILERYIDLDETINGFIKKDEPSSVDLNLMEELIEILKIFYSNGETLISDVPYDYALNKFKSYRPEPILEVLVVDRRTKNTTHEYPELKGTIDKCNMIFKDECEKDLDADIETFIRKLFSVSYGEPIRLRLSKKYDGSSIVMSINEHGKPESFITRGEDGKGIDLSHLFPKLKFKGDKKRGVQFELIMTKENFNKYCNDIGKEFANLRSAVTSILTSAKAAKYSKYLTPVPLNMSDDYSISSSAKMNKLYATDVTYDYIIIEDYSVDGLMDKINDFIFQVSESREELNYAIDGIVIDCLNEDIRKELGRKNDKNKYQIAYKFPPLRAITEITGLDITVGRLGQITPVLYYDWVNFNGTDHNHSSISSYGRFTKMDLHVGEEILLTYNNDVMPYPSKLADGKKGYEALEFPDKCKCGSELVLHGANYFCENPVCSYKLIPSYAYFYENLGVRDFKESRVEKMVQAGAIHGYHDLLEPNYEKMTTIEKFGSKLISSFKKQITNIKSSPISEVKLVKALGLIGETYAKEILSLITLDELLEDPDKLMQIEIFGIGIKIKSKFIKNLLLFKQIIDKIKSQIKVVPVDVTDNKVQICFTGFRDKNLKALLERVGFEVLNSFKKSCSYVITPEEGYVSETTKKAINRKVPIPVLSLERFKDDVLAQMKHEL